ncbi:MAG: RIP metalloprotease RseP, partial [Acidobacteriota bacterium]
MNIGFDNLFAFATIFGLLVFLHEAGHFVLAKLSGIRVEVFSLGFGPRIFGWRGKVTDYRVSLVPLGGYVKMLGEEAEMDLVGGTGEEHAPPETLLAAGGRPLPADAFTAKTRWQRFLVMSAGAVMNLILAFLIVTGMDMAGRREPAFLAERPRLASIEPDSPAEQAGFQPGDIILSVDNQPIASWDELQQSILFNPGRHLSIQVERQGQVLNLDVKVTLPPEGSRTHRYRIGYIGLTQPAYDVKVWRVEAESAAEKAGMAVGDIIQAIEDEPIYTSEDVVRMISARPDQPTRIRVLSGDETVDLLATPAPV